METSARPHTKHPAAGNQVPCLPSAPSEILGLLPRPEDFNPNVNADGGGLSSCSWRSGRDIGARPGETETELPHVLRGLGWNHRTQATCTHQACAL